MFGPFRLSAVLQASKTKNKLIAAVKKGVVIPDTEKLEAKLRRKLRTKYSQPLQGHSARVMVSNMLKIPLEKVPEVNSMTAFSPEELKRLFKTKVKRLKYNILGTNAVQLRDSKVINQKTEKFLLRKDLPRAMEIAHLAGKNGVFAYGTIMKFLAKEGRLNMIWELLNQHVKKRGLRPDGRMLTIFFDAFATARYPDSNVPKITENQAVLVYEFLLLELCKREPVANIFHVNTAMKALRLAGKHKLAIRVFNRLKDYNIRPDAFTYTEYFSSLRHSDDYTEAVREAEKQFRAAQRQNVKLDVQLVQAYSSIFVFSDDSRLQERGLLILRRWFDVCPESEIDISVDYDDVDPNIAVGSGSTTPRRLSDDVDATTILLPKSEINKRGTRFEATEQIKNRHATLCMYFNVHRK
ncbi:hypothetical protein KL933_001592 [Ogataea haglerorum]|uniref:Mitochondrial 15S rRNA processing factor CCM1 n=1 Tax=Ogataea haglerorum TaxID=1937702 RepID=A0AAN6D7S3_9ASCO|nr:hypothetical protein KL933_001592 [Ogataea haglerorum]KAG7732054.1 hypothetical protein KL948_002252 [Ogataea haglerorum]